MKQVVRNGWILLCLWAATGCGAKDDDATEIQKVNLSVPAQTPLSEMEEEDLVTLCTEYFTGLSQIDSLGQQQDAETACMNWGVTRGAAIWAAGGADADMVKACKEASSECLAELERSGAAVDTDPLASPEAQCADLGHGVVNCEALAGDVVRCFNAMLIRLAAPLDEVEMPRCSVLSAIYFERHQQPADTEETEFTAPPLCTAVFEQCPRLSKR